MVEPVTLLAAIKNEYDWEMFTFVAFSESFDPSKVITDFPFNPLAVKVGFLLEVDCVAWLAFPLLSDHWLTELELCVTEVESEASNQSSKF